uniref:Protein kinase domain-containing protein n=1 Tax=Arcella intermedia TaxID=1963864 RepID=A0A6B2LUA8_9EUKA
MRRLYSVLEYIHSFDLIHKDLRINNILIDEVDATCIKLGDFGLANVYTDDQKILGCQIGIPNHLAPEIFKGNEYGKEIDMWAAGDIGVDH